VEEAVAVEEEEEDVEEEVTVEIIPFQQPAAVLSRQFSYPFSKFIIHIRY
jgi:hypothetical protein